VAYRELDQKIRQAGHELLGLSSLCDDDFAPHDTSNVTGVFYFYFFIFFHDPSPLGTSLLIVENMQLLRRCYRAIVSISISRATHTTRN
jgi:hypothetical protein